MRGKIKKVIIENWPIWLLILISANENGYFKLKNRILTGNFGFAIISVSY